MKTYDQFHDGYLEGLRIEDKGMVQVYLNSFKKERTTALLSGVLMLKATGFKEGNIILDVSTWGHEEITLEDIADLYELESGHEPAAWEHQLMNKIKEQRLEMFAVNPSYGGTCLILAQTIEFVASTDNV